MVVNSIRQDCKQRGLNVAIVCLSRIASKVYKVVWHPQYIPFMVLPTQKCHGNNYFIVLLGIGGCEKLRTVLICDDASMLSARMMELANALHHHLSSEESGLERLPFADKQVIIVGELLQLCLSQALLTPEISC